MTFRVAPWLFLVSVGSAACGEAAVKLGDDTGGSSLDETGGDGSESGGGDSAGESGADSSGGNAGDSSGDSSGDTSGDSAGDSGADTDSGSGGLEYTGGAGPYGVSTLDDNVDGSDVTYFVPNGGEPWPVVVWSHGFARSKDNQASAAARAASRRPTGCR